MSGSIQTSGHRQVRLLLNLFPNGYNRGSWQEKQQAEQLSFDFEGLTRTAERAEAAKFDGLLLADHGGGLDPSSQKGTWRAFDPSILLTALSQHTSNIGLVSTISALFGTPAEVARRISSLDHISRGRVALNLITTQSPTVRGPYGIADEFAHDEKYRVANEFTEIVHKFWDSLPNEAIIADPTSGTYVDHDRLRPVHVNGDHFRASGTLSLPGGHQQRPLIFQAGASDTALEFGLRWADALFRLERHLEQAKTSYAKIVARSETAGRRPPLILPGLFIYPGATEEEAIRHKRELDERINIEAEQRELARIFGLAADQINLDRHLPYDLIDQAEGHNKITGLATQVITEAQAKGWTARDIILNNGLGAHRVLVGSGEQIAEDIITWVDGRAADGFVFSLGDYDHDLPIVAQTVIPELQKRGRFRTEYDDTATTFRQNLNIQHG